MNGASNITFMIFAGLAALLVAIPLPKALASGNVGTSMVVLWSFAACVVQLINAALWNGNVKNWAPAWCDFCGYFLIATDLALSASGLCITRRLYLIVTLDPGRHKKVLNMVVDIFLCLVMPWVLSALEYVVQQYRFYVYEDIGCLPGIASVNLAFPLVWMLPLTQGVVSAGYAYLTIRENLRRSNSLVGDLGKNSAWSRRLLALGVVSALYGLVPNTMAIVFLATAFPVLPWPGWSAIHSTINDVVYVPAEEWQSRTIAIASTELRRWTIVSLALVVFLFLGFTEDVIRMFWSPFRSIIEQSFSSDRAGKTVLEQNAGGGLKDLDQQDVRSSHYRRSGGFIPLGDPHAIGRRENLALSDKPWLDLEGESFELIYPVSPPPAATRPTYLPRIPQRERIDGVRVSYI